MGECVMYLQLKSCRSHQVNDASCLSSHPSVHHMDSPSKSQVVADQSGLCKWIKKADGTIVVASKPSSLLAVEGDLKGGRARIVVAFLGSNRVMRI